MLRELTLYYSVMKYGKGKGQLNTFKKRVKYIGRNILVYKYAKDMANFILSHKYLKDEIYRYPSLCTKIHRPYLTNTLENSEKIKAIISAYEVLDRKFPENILEQLYKDGKLELCTFIGKGDLEYKISINLYPNYEKEGEFTLVCYNFEDKPLAKLTFGFLDNSIIIGGLQGLEKGENPNLIKEATKSMYGIFPKKIVLEVLYLLFPEYEIIGVGRDKHIYFSDHYRKKKEGKVYANYDEFWESIDGIEKDGMWILPTKLERKKLEDIPSKKRSLYQNRFSLLDSIFENISLKINS
ncbi:VirK/YbjX family protein [uncultured Fusobacterium sp.]|uniref:VirK/YbjX family protein n=1 Tax=uncultured Fusobacterium sp. TaxID=159267 RepID=UPI0025EEF2BD|nr:VirK/YbjX family protein [uncultured Fusobacterium sp.]